MEQITKPPIQNSFVLVEEDHRLIHYYEDSGIYSVRD